MAPTTIPAPLLGKVAIVTGGTRGIGEATALTLVRKGISHLAITYASSSGKAEQVLKAAKEINPDLIATAFKADITESDSGKHTIETALKDLSVDHIDIVVSNAVMTDSIETYGPVETADHAKFNNIFAGVTWTPLQLCLEALKVMPEGGRLILNSSISSKAPTDGPMLLYSVAKAALDAVARNLAAEYSLKRGITINSISIGSTDTDAAQKLRDVDPELMEELAKMSSLKRIGTSQEVANVIAFVASPEAGWINGNNVPANGGSLLSLQG